MKKTKKIKDYKQYKSTTVHKQRIALPTQLPQLLRYTGKPKRAASCMPLQYGLSAAQFLYNHGKVPSVSQDHC